MPDLRTLCDLVNGRLQGDPAYMIQGIASLERAGASKIALCTRKHVAGATLQAGALIVAADQQIDYPRVIFVDSPYIAFAALLDYFHPYQPPFQGISPLAQVAADATIGAHVAIGPFVSIGSGASIGEYSEIHAGVQIYNGVTIGSHCRIYANVVLREHVVVGDRVIIQPGAVIGADGFGFTRTNSGEPVKIPQIGRVIIGADCEIGANTCIDRSTLDDTVLDAYVKLDNLVQIGHNVQVGKNTAISAQSGISGSVMIGENVIMGGQVGIADHVKIAAGVEVAAGTGVSGSIKSKLRVAGRPHMEFDRWRKNNAIARNLIELRDKVMQLEEKIKTLEDK